MEAKIVLLLITLCLASVTMAMLVDELPDCNNLGCPENEQPDPVCGTDGQTYTTSCQMELVNQKRICWIGHFNVIYKLHDGPCGEPTSTVAFAG